MVKGMVTRADFERFFPPKDLSTTGDRWLIKWRGSQTLRYEQSFEILGPFLKNDNRKKLLDIGCAQSNFLLLLNRHFPDIQLYGSDISNNAITWSREHYSFINYEQCTLPEVAFSKEVFDYILALEVLYYLGSEDRLLALKNIVAALKPGGVLLVSGVLDGGKQYFSDRWILQTLRSMAEVKVVDYNYSRFYTRLESLLLSGRAVFYRFFRYADVSMPSYSVLSREPDTSGNTQPTRGERGCLGRWSKTAGSFLITLVESMLAWVWLPRLCRSLTKRALGKKGRTQIIVLAKKKADAP